MIRRKLLMSAALFASGALDGPNARSNNTEKKHQISAGKVRFNWHFEQRQLYATLRAPTAGWLAVGFNQRRELQGTEFVIACVSRQPVDYAERIAQVPNHIRSNRRRVNNFQGHYAGGISQISFAYASIHADAKQPHVARGGKIHLMLAWSQACDFNHHSAWRRHYDVEL